MESFLNKNKYEEMKKKLETCGQEHLLQFYSEITPEQQEKLLEEIELLDVAEILELTKNNIQNNSEKIRESDRENNTKNSDGNNVENGVKNSLEYNKEEVILEPMEALDKEKMSSEKKLEYEKIGNEIIKKAKVAVCTMAGGQGTRLGHDGPKGTFIVPLKNPKSIFEIATEHMLRAYKEFNVYLDWFIMTSEENDIATKDFFEENNYFKYDKDHIHFFKQGQLPLFSMDGKILLKSKYEIFKAANGNGGIFKALEENNILEYMEKKQIEYLVTCNVDNILIKPIDPLMLGILKSGQTELGIKSVIKRDPKEPVGVCCLKNGKPTVVEYIDLPKELAEEKLDDGSLKYGEVHFGCNYLSISLLKKIANEKLVYHAAKKKNHYWNENGVWVENDEINSIKYEMFIFDGFEKAESAVVFRTKREEEFAPIKYKDGEDSPQTACKMYENYMYGAY